MIAFRTHRTARVAMKRAALEMADELYAPRRRLSIVDWVEEHVVLPPGSPREGKFRYEYTPYLREIIETIASPSFTFGAIAKAAQVGYSVGVLLNYVGFRAVESPDSIVLMLPTEEEAKSFSKDKIRNLLEFSPTVGRAFPNAKSRDTDATILEKRMRAGPILRLLGSKSTSRTRSFSSPVLLFDEIDEYEADGSDQGDVIALLSRASIQYGLGRAKKVVGSTPTLWRNATDGDEATQHERGSGSRSWREYLDGDQREWWCVCPHCRVEFVPKWAEHVWFPKDGTPAVRAAAAHFVCPSGCEIQDNHEKEAMVSAGGYRARRPGAAHPSWHINGLISFAPGMRLRVLVKEFLEAGKDPSKLQPFFNLRLGLPFIERRGAAIVVESLEKRRAPYPAEVPAPVGLITIAVDVQENPGRLEVLVVGWGAGEESWRLHHFRLLGDPMQLVAKAGEPPSVWQRLDGIIQRRWVHESGVGLKATRIAIDSGFAATTVYQYIAPRQRWGVFAVKGEQRFTGVVKRSATPTLTKPGKASMPGVRLVMANTYELKRLLFRRLRIEGDGPGAMHWPLLLDPDGRPLLDEFPPDYWPQFKNEHLEVRRLNAHSDETEEVYVKTGPNEAIDLEGLSLVALEDCGADVKQRLAQFAHSIAEKGRALRAGLDMPVQAPPARRVSGGFHRPRSG